MRSAFRLVELVTFPLSIPELRLLRQPELSPEASFIVAGFYTSSHAHYAERLAESLRARHLPHALYQVPTVHRSISRKGSGDIAYSKPNFVRFALATWRLPVLYLDVDVVVLKHPDLIFRAVTENCDLAIYNWLADEDTDAYVPLSIGSERWAHGESRPQRFYRYSHSIDFTASDQLVCSGAVQLWRDSAAAHRLLRAWLSTICTFEDGADDPCLDFAFNNDVGGARAELRTVWLPKPYARYAWWIYDEPVIDHPELPASGEGFGEVGYPDGLKRFYPERASRRRAPPALPRDCLIDTDTRRIIRVEGSRLIPIGRVADSLWLPCGQASPARAPEARSGETKRS